MKKGQGGDISAGASRQTWRHRFVDLLKATWYEYERDHARYFAVAMVYYALVSLVPLLLLAVAALGLLLRFSEVAATAEQQLLFAVEARVGAEVRDSIGQLLELLEQESIIATVISLAGVLLTASLLFKQLRLTFRAIWKHQPPLVSGSARLVVLTTFLEQVKALALIATAGVLLLLGLGLFTAVQWLSGLFGETPLVGGAGRWLLSLTGALIIISLTFALLFKFLPPVRLPWRHVWLASLLCAVAWIITAEILALYGAFFGSSFGAAGAFGGVLAIMLWMNIVSQGLFYGAELCKVIAQREGWGQNSARVPIERRADEPRRRAG